MQEVEHGPNHEESAKDPLETDLGRHAALAGRETVTSEVVDLERVEPEAEIGGGLATMPSGAQCVHGTTNHLRRSSEGPAAEDRAEEGPGIALVAGAQPDQSVADQAAGQKAANKSGPSASTAAASRTAADLGVQAGPRRRTRTDPALEEYTGPKRQSTSRRMAKL